MPLGSDQKAGLDIVYFDGVCGLCNAWVDLLLRKDVDRRLFFAPLQSPIARAHLPAHLLEPPFATVVIKLRDGQVFLRSEAVVRALGILGGSAGGLGRLIGLLPLRLRDSIYGKIAQNRYVWFGKRDLCRVPTQQEKGRILFDVLEE